MKTLVLEPDQEERDAIRQLLLSRGHDVIACDSWESIIDILDQTPIQMACLDWGPPAAQWVARASAHEHGSQVLVIALLESTHLGDLEHLNAIFEQGANDYMVRPLGRPEHLHRLMQLEFRYESRARSMEARNPNRSSNLEFAVEYSGDIVEITDHEARYVYVNQGFTRTMGYTFAEAVGRTPAELVRSDYHPLEYYENIFSTIKSGGMWKGELVSKNKRGGLVFQDTTVTGIRDKSGHLTRFVAVKRDITDRKMAEKQARETTLRLQATLRSLSEAVISVDCQNVILLANPAACTMACVDGASGDSLVGQHIDQALKLEDDPSRARIWDPISTLLARQLFQRHESRISAVDARGQRHPVLPVVTIMHDEHEEIIGAVLVIRDMTQERRAEQALADKAAAEADSRSKALFLQAVSHQLRTPMNGIVGMASLLASTRIDGEQGEMLQTLQHSADLMSEVIDRLLDEARTDIDFWPALPDGDLGRPPHDTPVDSLDHTGAHILLVDDNAVNRRVVQHMLERLDLPFHMANDGREAISAVCTRHFDIILMDCHMPRMGGFEATRVIREYEQITGRRSVIIAVTANGARDTRESCIAAGMDDFIAKPLSLDRLREALEPWLVRSVVKPSDGTP